MVAQVTGLMQEKKVQEKEASGDVDTGVLDGVPLALPALTRAIKLQNKAAKVGFDWPDMEPVFDKLREEIGELEEATRLENPSRRKIAEEYGDLLFVMANLARHMRIDPEDALRQANAKFVRRFEFIEARLKDMGKTPDDSDLDDDVDDDEMEEEEETLHDRREADDLLTRGGAEVVTRRDATKKILAQSSSGVCSNIRNTGRRPSSSRPRFAGAPTAVRRSPGAAPRRTLPRVAR